METERTEEKDVRVEALSNRRERQVSVIHPVVGQT
jgi:hypothetical protein